MAAGREGVVGDPDPRDSLANERTLLAWARTALALIAGGLAVSQLARPSSRIITLVSALALICFGALMSLFGYWHRKRNEKALRRGHALGRSALPGLLTNGVGWFALAAAVLAVLRFTA